MKSRRFLLLGALAIVLVGTSNVPSAAQSSVGELLSEADAYLKAEMRNRGIPGLAVAVVRDGRIVATQAYGVANLELNVPVTLDTVFPIASLDKQLTASGIMPLVQDGKVRLCPVGACRDSHSPPNRNNPRDWSARSLSWHRAPGHRGC
jgi:CubicO group peptidase (beta-lactamase class C family)